MKIKSSTSTRVKNIVCIVVIATTYLYLILNWNNIPEKIPGHYNAAGVIDRWGAKGELWVTPIIMLILYTGITVLEKFPQIWNTGVTVTEENKERVYLILKNMIVTEKLIVCVAFGYITINSSLVRTLSVWFLPSFLILMFGSLVFYIVKLNKAK